MLTAEEVRSKVTSTVQGMLDDLEFDTDREQLIERMDEECDSLWGSLVYQGSIPEYGVHELVQTAQESAVIIQVATEDAWAEDDHGLWDGLTYGVLASIAYFSLRNLLYNECKERHGVDSNNDQPLKRFVAKKAIMGMSRERAIELLTEVGIECRDDESDGMLTQAVLENVVDGTIEFDQVK